MYYNFEKFFVKNLSPLKIFYSLRNKLELVEQALATVNLPASAELFINYNGVVIHKGRVNVFKGVKEAFFKKFP